MSDEIVESMEDKVYRARNEAYRVIDMFGGPLGIADARELNRIKPEDYEMVWMLAELYVPWIQKWIEGRMSIADIRKHTPEKVEAELDCFLKHLEPYLKMADPGFTFLTLQEAYRLYQGDRINTTAGPATIIEPYDLCTKMVTVQIDEQKNYVRWYATVLVRATRDLEARTCAYCGKWRTKGNWTVHSIWQNGREVNKSFCVDDACATNAQMSAEG